MENTCFLTVARQRVPKPRLGEVGLKQGYAIERAEWIWHPPPRPRIALLSLLFFIGTTALWADDGHKAHAKAMDIYLLIGQSNMAGRAPYGEAESQPIDGVQLLNDQGRWEPAANPLNRHSTIRKALSMQRLGPGYSFALAMKEARPRQSIGLVVNAKGGTTIEEWAKGTEIYTEAIRRTRIALKSGTLRGILWHQGEGNRHDAEYFGKIAALIAALRADLEAPEVPFIAGQINSTVAYRINGLILKLPERVPHTAVVSSKGLTAMDLWHFDHDSMIQLGRRYAEKLLEIQQGNNPR